MPIFLKISSIAGDTTVVGFKGQFEIQGYSWGDAETSKGKPSFSSFTIQMPTASKSPSLMLACAQGTDLGDVIITVVNTSGNGSPEAKSIITLSHAAITSWQQTADSGSPSQLALSFAFSRVDYRENVFDANGKVSSFDDHSWDLASNQGK